MNARYYDDVRYWLKDDRRVIIAFHFKTSTNTNFIKFHIYSMEDRSYSIDTYVKDNFFELHDDDGNILIDMISNLVLYPSLSKDRLDLITLTPIWMRWHFVVHRFNSDLVFLFYISRFEKSWDHEFLESDTLVKWMIWFRVNFPNLNNDIVGKNKTLIHTCTPDSCRPFFFRVSCWYAFFSK